MIKLEDNKKTNFFFDKHNMLLDREGCWDNCGMGDALWRTALISLPNSKGKQEILRAIHKCVYDTPNGYKFQRHPLIVNHKCVYDTPNGFKFQRHPLIVNIDCSRDQAVMALVTLKLNRLDTYKEITDNLSFRISNKHTWRDAYLWAKGKYKLWRAISFYRFFGLKLEPSYSVHLFCWQIWSSKERMKLFKWFLIKYIIPKENYLCRALLGVKEEIPKLKPMIDFRWQRDYPWGEGRNLTEEESGYNCLDLEVLKFVVNYKS